MSLPATLELVPFPGRSAAPALHAYEPEVPAVVTYPANGARVRLVCVYVWASELVRNSVDVIMQTKTGRDYKTGGRGTMPLASFLSRLHPADAAVVRQAVAAAELDRRMRAQMTTDPEAGGPRDPQLPDTRCDECDSAEHVAADHEYAEADLAGLVDESSAEAAGPAYAARERPPGAEVERSEDRMVFTLHRHGVETLARLLKTTPEEITRAALRTGWVVES